MVHFGMHGTVEWLPGAPLGNTALSWSDTLLGAMPNVYVYAANNPSESIVAKRRGEMSLHARFRVSVFVLVSGTLDN